MTSVLRILILLRDKNAGLEESSRRRKLRKDKLNQVDGTVGCDSNFSFIGTLGTRPEPTAVTLIVMTAKVSKVAHGPELYRTTVT